MTERIFKMKPRRDGFTAVELLTVIAIIAILVGIFIPTVSFVRNTAKEAKQSVQLTAIDMALMAFKGDYGDYPPSDNEAGDYCGAQKLAEALVGWDLLGFHPDSDWRADGGVYEPPNPSDNNLDERVGPYLELATANAFQLGSLFYNTGSLDPNGFVLCDSFGAKPVTVGNKIVKAGTPILYYKADTSSKQMLGRDPKDWRYSPIDNQALLDLKKMINGTIHPLGVSGNFYMVFSDYVMDPKIYEITGRRWPYRPDSYILISAGVDGLYGTPDDICNF
jgi:prepilin-type N-terminal cleavage/methylation domain-containing protein